MPVYEAVYYIAHHFGVAGEGASTPQKDLIYDRGRVGSLANVELGTVTGSATLFAIWRRWLEAGIDGHQRITKIQGMSAASFLVDHELIGTGESALCLLSVTKLLPKVCLDISADRDFAR